MRKPTVRTLDPRVAQVEFRVIRVETLHGQSVNATYHAVVCTKRPEKLANRLSRRLAKF